MFDDREGKGTGVRCFEDEGRGRKPRNTGGHQKPKMAKKHILPSKPPEETSSANIFSPVKLILDIDLQNCVVLSH